MKKKSLVVLCALVTIGAAFAAPPSLAVVDFSVTSDNPRLKYVGKGLAEMVAAELAASKGIVLVDRERRAALLGEMEFALSGLASAEAQLEMGKLLAVDYLLFGEIVDMDSAVLVSCRMIKVETGAVAWSDKNLGPLADYDGISKKLAASALKGIGAGRSAAAAPAPAKAPKVAAAKREEALLAFSGAVDSLDKKDTSAAKKQIEVAKAIDPRNAAVAIYAAKLASGSPRFLVELEKYAPTYNPALLGLIDKGGAYSWVGVSRLVGSDVGEYGIVAVETPTPGGGLKAKEAGFSTRLGALLPLGAKAGLMAEAVISNSNLYSGFNDPSASAPFVVEDPAHKELNLDFTPLGAVVGGGCQVAPGLSLGVSLGAAYLQPNNTSSFVGSWSAIYPETVGLHFLAAAGAAYRTPDGTFSAELEAVYSSLPEFYVLAPPGGIADGNPGSFKKGQVPLIASLGLTGGFLDQRLFANLKTIGEIGLDARGYFSIRAMPGLELWPLPWLALRGVYEYSHLTVGAGAIRSGGGTASGSGFMGGVTVVLGSFELSANYINRYRPFRLLPGAGHQDNTFLVGLVWNGLGARR